MQINMHSHYGQATWYASNQGTLFSMMVYPSKLISKPLSSLQYIVEQIPALSMSDVCTATPVHGKAFYSYRLEGISQALSSTHRLASVHRTGNAFAFTLHIVKRKKASNWVFHFVNFKHDFALHTTEEDSATQEEEQQIEKVLDATAVDTGESAAKSQDLFVELASHGKDK